VLDLFGGAKCSIGGFSLVAAVIGNNAAPVYVEMQACANFLGHSSSMHAQWLVLAQAGFARAILVRGVHGPGEIHVVLI